MAMSMEEVAKSYQSLKQEWNNKKTKDLKKCGTLLKTLKVALTELRFLPTGYEATKQELLLARDILEIGAEYSIAVSDIPSFERYMAQLKSYYFDHSSDLPDSPYKYQLLGLNLLRLLSQNKLAEFHTELELLPVDEIQNNVYIRHPVSMEQYLMEGSYHKVFLARGNVPANSYNFFMDVLLNTTRQEIASCLEKVYKKLPVREAARMLYFKTDADLKQFATSRQWVASADGYYNYGTSAVGGGGAGGGGGEEKAHTYKMNTVDMALQTVVYAKEMEMIV